jgi:hypothetical protein
MKDKTYRTPIRKPNKPWKRTPICVGVVVSINACSFCSTAFNRLRLNEYSKKKLYLLNVLDLEWFENLVDENKI